LFKAKDYEQLLYQDNLKIDKGEYCIAINSKFPEVSSEEIYDFINAQ
jgi:hypothetical protein